MKLINKTLKSVIYVCHFLRWSHKSQAYVNFIIGMVAHIVIDKYLFQECKHSVPSDINNN